MNEESTDIVAVPNPLFEALAQPFPISEIEFRAGATNQEKTKALALAYITSRAGMARLDAVMGPGNWKDEYTAGPAGGVLCSLSLRIDGEWITKQDGADNTNFEAVKGGFSDAFKRACVKWGIGRYLYYLEGTWVKCQERGKTIVLAEDPRMPAWALPGGAGVPSEVAQAKPKPVEELVKETSPKETGKSQLPKVQDTPPGKIPETTSGTTSTAGRQKNQWEQDVIKILKGMGLVDSPQHLVAILNRSPFVDVPYGELELYDAAVYLCGWHDYSGKNPNMTTDEKNLVINKLYLDGAPKEWEDAAKHILGMKL